MRSRAWTLWTTGCWPGGFSYGRAIWPVDHEIVIHDGGTRFDRLGTRRELAFNVAADGSIAGAGTRNFTTC